MRLVAVVAGMAAVAAVRLVAASWRCAWWRRRGVAVVARWPITTYDSFISIRAITAQFITALPYVKPRQIAKNPLVFPN